MRLRGTPALKVHSKLLVRLRPEDESLVVPGVTVDEREMLIAAEPSTFHTTRHYADHPMVLVRLAACDPARLRPFLLRRWRAVAPKRLVARFEAASTTE